MLAVEEELICQLPASFERTTPAARALPWWFHHFITGRTVSNLGIVWPLQMSLIQFAHRRVLLEGMSLDVSHALWVEVARWMGVGGSGSLRLTKRNSTADLCKISPWFSPLILHGQSSPPSHSMHGVWGCGGPLNCIIMELHKRFLVFI